MVSQLEQHSVTVYPGEGSSMSTAEGSQQMLFVRQSQKEIVAFQDNAPKKIGECCSDDLEFGSSVPKSEKNTSCNG